ncbi:MAG: zinc ribbon domain-containing protein [Nitrososphaerales archaeon]|nr:zinc ribbon domain-containing protein [Nitrososphaerales archaeon]
MFCPKCGTQLPDQAAFCYKCGVKIGLVTQPQSGGSGSGQVIAPSGTTQLKCPSCGAPIAPKFGEMIITCAYCGSSVSLANDGWRSIQKHTMLPLKFSSQDDVLKIVHGQIDRGLLHRHLMEQSTMEEMNLALVPYWLIPVSARTSLVAVDMAAEAGSIATTALLAGMLGGAMGGRRGGGGAMMGGVLLGTMMGGGMGGGQGTKRAYQMDNDYNYPVVALKALTEYQPKEYQFQLADRALFDATKVKGVKVMNGDVGEDTAKYQAKTMVDQLQSEKAHAAHHMIQQLSTESDLGEGELLHAPVWFVRYDHKGTKIALVVDGNSGGIINSIGL